MEQKKKQSRYYLVQTYKNKHKTQIIETHDISEHIKSMTDRAFKKGMRDGYKVRATKLKTCKCGSNATHKRAGLGINAKPWQCVNCYKNSEGENNAKI